MPNPICKECGHPYGSHRADGNRCPDMKDGHIVGFYATHFEPEISETDQLRAEIARLTAGSEAMQEDANRKSLIIFAKEQEISELTRMLFALGKQDGQTIRELTEENRGLRQMLHMEPR